MTVGSWIPTRWAQGDFAGWNLAEEWVFNGFLMILRDFHPPFFADFSPCFCHIHLQHPSNFNKFVAFNTCDAGHEFTDTFRLHYLRRVEGVNSSLMEFLKSALLDGCYDMHHWLKVLLRNAFGEETPCAGGVGKGVTMTVVSNFLGSFFSKCPNRCKLHLALWAL